MQMTNYVNFLQIIPPDVHGIPALLAQNSKICLSSSL